jgi:hypothetical protein
MNGATPLCSSLTASWHAQGQLNVWRSDVSLVSLYCGILIKKLFDVYGSLHRNNTVIYIQQDANLHSLFYLETALHISGGTFSHHQERKQLYLQHLVLVTPLLLSAAIVEEVEPV